MQVPTASKKPIAIDLTLPLNVYRPSEPPRDGQAERCGIDYSSTRL